MTRRLEQATARSSVSSSDLPGKTISSRPLASHSTTGDSEQILLIAFRVGVLAMSLVLTTMLSDLRSLALPLALLTVVALAASLPLPPWRFAAARPAAEALAAALILGLTTTQPEALLPYLIVPPLAVGLEVGLGFAIGTAVGSAVIVLACQSLAHGMVSSVLIRSVAEWAALSLATGAVGAWARGQSRTPDSVGGYRDAHELLIQLRDVTRALPTGLDEVSLGKALLDEVATHASYQRAAIYTLNDKNVLLALTVAGADRVDWNPQVAHRLRPQAELSGEHLASVGSFSDPNRGYSAVLPMRLGDTLLGAVALEREDQPWQPGELAASQTAIDNAALQLDAGRLFGEVRTLATIEERQRLAREIHDGIAQEIASLGYVVDELAADESDAEQRGRILALRQELSRVVSELRLSIFDLRSDVHQDAALGAALSSYVRQVGTASGMTIHLVLDESSQRLPIATETELLRITQEAVTNARRHAHARNLWVTCRVSPPDAFLRIADDGAGRGSPRIDSYGLDIMRERAERLGESLVVRDRDGGGTVIEITLGGSKGEGAPATLGEERG